MDYSQYANTYNYAPGSYPAQQPQQQYAPGSYPTQQPQQQYATPPAIRNPFPAPPPPHTAYGGQNSGYDPEHEAQLAAWQSTYAPQEQNEKGKKNAPGGKGDSTVTASAGPRGADVSSSKVSEDGEKKTTVVRKGGGQTWEDSSLLEWDPTQFRIMVGNLAGEVTDDSLAKAFAQYGVSKARVVRDKRTTKSKGYGFVAFTDGELGFKAAREMVGKYIGSHPVTIQRSKTDLRPVSKKDDHRNKNKNKNNNKNRDKTNKKKEEDPLRAQTGAHIEKKPVRNPGAYKVIG